MTRTLYKRSKHCRWCRKHYRAAKPEEGDGFCSSKHKQAHYRAYKKYVTLQASSAAQAQGNRVTPKKRKKRK